MRIRNIAAAVVAVIAGTFGGVEAARADDSDSSLLYVGAGAWQVLRSDHTEAEFNLAWRPNYKLWIFKPHFGVMAATDGDYYGYGGLLVDLYWGKKIVMTLSTAVGGYGGGGYDMGSHVEFRSGIDLAYRFENNARLGIGFYHMSNAGLTDRNPGSESLLLSYSHPINF